MYFKNKLSPQIKLHLLHPEDWDGEFGFRFLADATFLITSLGRHNRAAGRVSDMGKCHCC